MFNNVIYSNREKKMQTLMITSFKTGEGKTTVTGNIGVAMAESLKKVLIIDTDTRNPKLHNLFGLKQSPGLVDVVCSEIDFHDAVQQTALPGLKLLPAGRAFHNPAALFQSRIFRAMIESFKKEYDHILFKTAPFGIITDAAPLSELSDGVVVVCRFNNTTEEEVRSVIENLEQIRSTIIGTVLTCFDPAKSMDYLYTAKKSYQSAYKEYFRAHIN
jgi:capsular exopolysaccharide synthesis family protein